MLESSMKALPASLIHLNMSGCCDICICVTFNHTPPYSRTLANAQHQERLGDQFGLRSSAIQKYWNIDLFLLITRDSSLECD